MRTRLYTTPSIRRSFCGKCLVCHFYRNPGSRGKDLIGDFRHLQAVNEEHSLRRYTRLAPTRSEGNDEPQTEDRHETPVDMSACPTGTYTVYVYVDDVAMSLHVVKK